MKLSYINGFPREVQESRSTVQDGRTDIHVVTRQLEVPRAEQRADPLLVVNVNGYSEAGRNWKALNAGLFRMAQENGQPLVSVTYDDPRGSSYRQGDLTGNAVAVTRDAAERFKMPALQVAHSNGSRSAVEGGSELTDEEALSRMLLIAPAGFGDTKPQSVLHMAAAFGRDAARGVQMAAASRNPETQANTLLFAADGLAASALHAIASPGRNLEQIHTTVATDMPEKVANQHFTFGNVEVVRGLRDVVCPPANIDEGLDAYGVPDSVRHSIDSTHTSFLIDPNTLPPIYDMVTMQPDEMYGETA